MTDKPAKSKPNPQKTSNSKSPINGTIPTDVLIEILRRLPLLSLVRCSCVRKSWHHLITSPVFHSTHAVHQLRDPNETKRFLLFKQTFDITSQSGTTSRYFTFIIEKGNNNDNKNNNLVVKGSEFTCPVGRNHSVVCCSDGLVCLYDFYQPKPEAGPMILWNPSLGKAVVVTVPFVRPLAYTVGGFPKVVFGVGFDWCLGVYKVVRVAYCNGRGGDSVLRAHVYCVSDGKWRNMGVTIVPQCIATVRWRGVCLNGVIHWICSVSVISDDGYYLIRQSILTFKLRNDEFGEILLPKDGLNVANQMLRVVVVPRHGKEVLGVTQIVKTDFSLWVMEEYGVKESWVKLFHFKFPGIVKDMNVVIMSDQFFLVQKYPEGWVSYDHNSRQISYRPVNLMAGLDFVDLFVESVILLGQREGVLTIP